MSRPSSADSFSAASRWDNPAFVLRSASVFDFFMRQTPVKRLAVFYKALKRPGRPWADPDRENGFQDRNGPFKGG